MATREQIQEYLDIRDNIDMTVNAVLNKIVSIDTIPEGEEKNMIKLTVETVENKQKYLREKPLYKEAIIEFKENFGSEQRGRYRFAKEHKLDYITFNTQFNLSFHNVQDYEYDKNIEGEFITYIQEEQFWEQIKSWAEKEFILCTCRACVLMETAILVCEHITNWNVHYCYPQFFLDGAASIEWIKKFEMRHRDEIDNLFRKPCSVAPVL